MTDVKEASQYDKLSKRIPFNEDIFEDEETYKQVLNDLLEDSTNIALSILYPFDDYSDIPLPKRFYNWQIRCAIELYNLGDKSGIKNYSENGISWSKESDGLSISLINELPTKVGVPKKTIIEEPIIPDEGTDENV